MIHMPYKESPILYHFNQNVFNSSNFLFTYSIYIFLSQSQYAAMTLTMSFTASTYLLLTKYVIFS